MNVLKAAKAGFRSISRSGGGTGRGWYFGRPEGGFDWSREAGLRYDNSVVFAAIGFACNAMTEVDIYVRRPAGGGTFQEVPGHPITQLLASPNPWYDLPTLMSGWIISELAGRGGMSYTYKHRSPAGKLVGLEYLPHFACRPYTAPDSPNFIDDFILSVRGGQTRVDPKDVLQQRFGPINPLWPQISVGPMEAVLQEICTDNQAMNFTAALLKNVGVTPHLITPALKGLDGEEIEFGDAQAKQIEAIWREKISGDKRGLPLVMPLPVSVENLSFSPEDMNLDAIHNVSEERICAALGIPPVVLQLGTGLENSNNRASAEAAARAAARSFTKPYMRRKAMQLTRDLVPELGEPGEEVCFRIEHIEALQDDKTEEADRDETACGGPWLTVNEVRQKRGLEPIEGGDVLRGPRSKPEPSKPNDSETQRR